MVINSKILGLILATIRQYNIRSLGSTRVDNGHSDTGYQIELNIRTAEVVMIIFKIHSQLSDRPTGSHYLKIETIIVINANQ
jgi:hypothetical protein